LSDDPIAREAVHLWCAVFGEPPPVTGDGKLMLELIIRNLPQLDYEPTTSGNPSDGGGFSSRRRPAMSDRDTKADQRPARQADKA